MSAGNPGRQWTRRLAWRTVCLLAILPVTALVAWGQGRSTLDGVYSGDQAKRGTATYVDKCSECHDGGNMAPELDGHDFLAEWDNKSLGDLYRQIQTTMPADAPGDLKEHDVLDLIAYVLQANGFPPGDQALDNVSALDAIKFVPKN